MGILWNNIKMVYYGDRLGMVSFIASAVTLYLFPIIWQVRKRKIYSTIRILFFFNWRIIALKHGISFCHTQTWISHRYTYIPSLLKTPSHLSPFHSSRLSQRLSLNWIEFPVSHNKFSLSIYFIYGNMYVSVLFSQFIPPSAYSYVHKSVFYVCVSIAALQIG